MRGLMADAVHDEGISGILVSGVSRRKRNEALRADLPARPRPGRSRSAADIDLRLRTDPRVRCWYRCCYRQGKLDARFARQLTGARAQRGCAVSGQGGTDAAAEALAIRDLKRAQLVRRGSLPAHAPCAGRVIMVHHVAAIGRIAFRAGRGTAARRSARSSSPVLNHLRIHSPFAP